jgi:hypothetical protein
MAAHFSLKSFIDGPHIIYIAPLLVAGSLLNIFSPLSSKHQFGQLEILGAFVIIGYYLWAHLGIIHDINKIGKKRIEFAICATVSIFSALVLFAPLITWQYISLYRAVPQRKPYIQPILTAIITLWIGSAIFFYGSYKYSLDKLNAAQSNLPTSSMPTPEGMQKP